jgi:hypothetical protein
MEMRRILKEIEGMMVDGIQGLSDEEMKESKNEGVKV